MRATFFDPGLDGTFDRLGYAVVPFLDPAALAEVAEVYARLGPAPDDPHMAIHFDFQSTSVEYKEAVRSALRPILEPRLATLLDRYHLFSPAFIMKWPGARGGFAPHQDASIVDETRHRSLSVWCPLVDVGVDGTDNGILRFVPGSHRFAHWIRAQNPGNFLFHGREQDIVDRYGVPVPVRAGEAIVFDHRVVHYSLPNETPDPRLVVVMGMHPAESPLLHYRRDETIDGPTEHFVVHEVDDDYYVRLDPFTVREGVGRYPEVGRVGLRRPDFSAAEFDRLCRTAGSRPRRRLPRLFTHRRGRVNARPFCFRCGTEDDLVGDTSDVEHGNVQFLCRSCSGVAVERPT